LFLIKVWFCVIFHKFFSPERTVLEFPLKPRCHTAACCRLASGLILCSRLYHTVVLTHGPVLCVSEGYSSLASQLISRCFQFSFGKLSNRCAILSSNSQWTPFPISLLELPAIEVFPNFEFRCRRQRNPEIEPLRWFLSFYFRPNAWGWDLEAPWQVITWDLQLNSTEFEFSPPPVIFQQRSPRNPISGEFLASPTTWWPSTCFYGLVGAHFAVVVGGDLAVAQVEPLATARRRTALMIFFIRRHSKWIPSSYASSRWRPSSKRRSETSFRWGAAARSTLDLMEPVYGNIGSVQGFLVWK
jgi:hypothetical protein